jgi:hypothetical protein
MHSPWTSIAALIASQSHSYTSAAKCAARWFYRYTSYVASRKVGAICCLALFGNFTYA